MAVNHQAVLIKAFFGDGAKWGIVIDYSLEDTPLGTMGPQRLIHDLPAHFLVMNGDILTDLDFAAFHDAYVASSGLFTISSCRRVQSVDYGVPETDSQRRLVGFREKPQTQYEVSMGVQMVGRKAVDVVLGDRPYGFDNLMVDLIATGRAVVVRAFDGYWLDIGRPDDYVHAIEEFEAMKSRFVHGWRSRYRHRQRARALQAERRRLTFVSAYLYGLPDRFPVWEQCVPRLTPFPSRAGPS